MKKKLHNVIPFNEFHSFISQWAILETSCHYPDWAKNTFAKILFSRPCAQFLWAAKNGRLLKMKTWFWVSFLNNWLLIFSETNWDNFEFWNMTIEDSPPMKLELGTTYVIRIKFQVCCKVIYNFESHFMPCHRQTKFFSPFSDKQVSSMLLGWLLGTFAILFCDILYLMQGFTPLGVTQIVTKHLCTFCWSEKESQMSSISNKKLQCSLFLIWAVLFRESANQQEDWRKRISLFKKYQ